MFIIYKNIIQKTDILRGIKDGMTIVYRNIITMLILDGKKMKFKKKM